MCASRRLLLRLLFLSIFILATTNTWSQNGEKYVVKGKVLVDGDDFSNVFIHSKNKISTEKIEIDSFGRFVYYVNWNDTYFFEFRKKGYITKIIEFSTKVPDDVNSQTIQPYSLIVQLIPVFEGVDTVFFKNPVAKIHFDSQLRDFDYDMDYSLAVKYGIDQMRERASANVISDKQESSSKQSSSKGSRMKDQSDRMKETSLVSMPEMYVKPPQLSSKSDEGKSVQEVGIYDGKEYDEGKTIEVFEEDDKKITKVVMKKGMIQHVYLKVEHHWGAVFYFVKYTTNGYRCISKSGYEFGVSAAF